jgi:endo-1,3(4)-beta-glucanase
VRIVGVVVGDDLYKERRIFTIDDSSGSCLDAVAMLKTAAESRGNTNSEEKEVVCTTDAAESTTATLASILSSADVPYPEIQVGTVVDVKGLLFMTRWGELRIQVQKMVIVKTTEDEVALWEKRDRFRRDILNKPWVMRSRDIRKCRKEAEKAEETADKKKRRILAMVEPVPLSPRGRQSKRLKTSTGGKKQSDNTEVIDFAAFIREGAKGRFNALGI